MAPEARVELLTLSIRQPQIDFSRHGRDIE
jgi:hypothetical protein